MHPTKFALSAAAAVCLAAPLAATAATQGAVVIRDGECTVVQIGASGPEHVTTGEVQIIATHNRSGTTVKKCQAWGLENTSGRAFVFSNRTAETPAHACVLEAHGMTFVTDNWQQTLSRNGEATLTCLFNPLEAAPQ